MFAPATTVFFPIPVSNARARISRDYFGGRAAEGSTESEEPFPRKIADIYEGHVATGQLQRQVFMKLITQHPCSANTTDNQG